MRNSMLSAADFLAQRRLNGQTGTRLPEALRPQNTEQAWQIQQAQTALLTAQGEAVGGWKCALPFDDKWVVAPILASTLHTASPVALFTEAGLCKIEPELGFVLQHDLPPRPEGYTESEIIAAVGSAHAVLELIQNRHWPDESASFYEHLADNLFNQGLFVGEAIPLHTALQAAEMTFKITRENTAEAAIINGKHPNGLPQNPLFWLVNFLSQHAIALRAGQIIITGSYAGLLTLPPNQAFTLQFGDWATLQLTFAPCCEGRK